ncbi:hypothetical protein GCM10022255_091010 [Dactylosporangium darangshiense]|uniref:Secreted protein n=1 Tax=Dactylosporangium darangshiense TaxID=579108 RepID=A0ABP8DP88_9ACTN
MRIPRRGLLGLAALAGLLTTLLAPQAAFAAYYGGEINHAASIDYPPDTDWYRKCVSVTGAMACLQPYGDDLYIYDSSADGHSAAMIWFDADSARSGTCVSQWGNGHWGWCNKDFTEGHTIYFAAAVYEAGNIVRNSSWVSTVT